MSRNLLSFPGPPCWAAGSACHWGFPPLVRRFPLGPSSFVATFKSDSHTPCVPSAFEKIDAFLSLFHDECRLFCERCRPLFLFSQICLEKFPFSLEILSFSFLPVSAFFVSFLESFLVPFWFRSRFFPLRSPPPPESLPLLTPVILCSPDS